MGILAGCGSPGGGSGGNETIKIINTSATGAIAINNLLHGTKYLLGSINTLSTADRQAVYGGNALRVFGRLEGVLKSATAAQASEGGTDSEGL
jgi:hypothetical protein